MYNHNILFLFAFLYEILIDGAKNLSINLGPDPSAGAYGANRESHGGN